MNNRKYKKQVNENGWMIKLQRACCGQSTPKFVGYCPFFWFTWLCLILSPLFLTIRLIALVVSLFADPNRGEVKRPKDKALLVFYQHLLRTTEIFNGNQEEALQWERDNNQETYRPIFHWIDKTPTWENCAKQVLLKHQQHEALVAARKEAIRDRSQFLRRIANYAGYVIRPILVLVCVFVIFWIGKGIYFLIQHLDLIDVIWCAKILGGVLLLTAIIASVFSLLSRVSRWWRKCPKRPGRFLWAYRWFLVLLSTLWQGVEFIAETISIIYTKECPLIEWGDESGPIEHL